LAGGWVYDYRQMFYKVGHFLQQRLKATDHSVPKVRFVCELLDESGRS
jgi:hypothetical protein